MAGSLGSLRALGLLAILAAVMLLFFSGVAQADNPCYVQCFYGCINRSATCQFSPSCVKSCEKACTSQDTCKHSSHNSVLLPDSAKREEAVSIQSSATEKSFVAM